MYIKYVSCLYIQYIYRHFNQDTYSQLCVFIENKIKCEIHVIEFCCSGWQVIVVINNLFIYYFFMLWHVWYEIFTN